MKIDQCQRCTVRGDIEACKVTPCNQHESWYAVTLQAKIAALEKDAARWRKLLSCCEHDHEIREHIEDAVDVIAFQHQVDFRMLDSMTPTEKIDAAMQFDAAMKGGA